MNLKKSIAKIFSANVIQLITGLIIGFWLPNVTTINGYANIKTYTLLVSYIGFLHLGFIDGLYIKYGGKKEKEIDKKELKGEYYFLLIFQFIISVLSCSISLLAKNIIVCLFSLTILPVMVSAFYRYYYQAIGDFKKYSIIMYLYSITYLISNVFLIFILKSDNYILYSSCTILAYFISSILFHISFMKKLKNIKPIINKSKIIKIIKVGFFILLGNLSIVGLFSIDKWFIKLFFTNKEFAYYSFAISMLNIINTLVSAISIVFYNYLFINNTRDKINKIKKYLMCLGGAASTSFFIISIIVKMFVSKYVQSLDIISVTFSVFPYMILINALYANLYKVNKNEKKYLKVVLLMLLISIIYNIVALILFKSPLFIAVATVLTMFTWTIYSSKDLNNVDLTLKTVIYLLVLTISFITLSHICNNIVGMFIYFVIFIVDSIVFGDINFKEMFHDFFKKKKIEGEK